MFELDRNDILRALVSEAFRKFLNSARRGFRTPGTLVIPERKRMQKFNALLCYAY